MHTRFVSLPQQQVTSVRIGGCYHDHDDKPSYYSCARKGRGDGQDRTAHPYRNLLRMLKDEEVDQYNMRSKPCKRTLQHIPAHDSKGQCRNACQVMPESAVVFETH